MKTALFVMALTVLPSMGCASGLKHSNVECDEYVYEYVHVPASNKVKVIYVDSHSGSYHEWRKLRRVHKIRRMKHKRKVIKKKKVVKYYH